MVLSKEKVFSIMESLLFMSPEPRPFSDFLTLFKDQFSSKEIKELLSEFKEEYNKKPSSGLIVEKVASGWQMRTKIENKEYLLKIKPPNVFRLSRPSLEVLAIIAFEQPCTKLKVDEIRGVDSGHLLRTLIEKELICLSGKSDLPGKPSLYRTSQKFLQVFGLDNLKDLPSQDEIKELFTDIKTE
ncbi:MAG: SMC-Scp complex subunit ScpB, partial [Bdellovibrionaceae bacterium]|nr:SMC-Scp complex subunit ScpB [Pseudobdellovibrionaceae bacterium]